MEAKVTHNSTHPDRRVSIGEQVARRERDQALLERQRMEDQLNEALDEVERLRQQLEESK
jgi:hypothetical protein